MFHLRFELYNDTDLEYILLAMLILTHKITFKKCYCKEFVSRLANKIYNIRNKYDRLYQFIKTYQP
jgi:uncharacterized membrane protein YjdF